MKIRVMLLGFIASVLLVLCVVGAGFAFRSIFQEVARRNKYRCTVFKKLASEQIDTIESKMLKHIDAFPSPPQSHVPRQLHDIIKTIDDNDFVYRTTLYIPDHLSTNAMWGFTAWRGYYTEIDGFARFNVKVDFEKAMRQAVDGDESAITELNERNQLIWYKVLDSGKSKAVIRIDGNRKAKFAKYQKGKEFGEKEYEQKIVNDSKRNQG